MESGTLWLRMLASGSTTIPSIFRVWARETPFNSGWDFPAIRPRITLALSNYVVVQGPAKPV